MKPILFNTDMVRAILDGRKIVTRRVVKFNPGQNPQWTGYIPDGPVLYGSNNIPAAKAPYRHGDILYVRETWRIQEAHRFEADARIEFKAGGPLRTIQFPGRRNQGTSRIEYDAFLEKWLRSGWCPSIHMPKEAARLFLRVTDVRAERLRDIDGLGAFDEGAVAEMPGACLPPNKPDGFDNWSADKQNEYLRSMATSTYIAKLEFANRLIKAFSKVWDATIKPADLPLYGWDANPWAWVIEFEKITKEQAYGDHL